LNYRESRSLFEATKKYIENVNSIDPVLAYIINKDIDYLLLNGGDDELMDINNLEEIKSYLEISILTLKEDMLKFCIDKRPYMA
jgi:hypothetical protein